MKISNISAKTFTSHMLQQQQANQFSDDNEKAPAKLHAFKAVQGKLTTGTSNTLTSVCWVDRYKKKIRVSYMIYSESTKMSHNQLIPFEQGTNLTNPSTLRNTIFVPYELVWRMNNKHSTRHYVSLTLSTAQTSYPTPFHLLCDPAKRVSSAPSIPELSNPTQNDT